MSRFDTALWGFVLGSWILHLGLWNVYLRWLKGTEYAWIVWLALSIPACVSYAMGWI